MLRVRSRSMRSCRFYSTVLQSGAPKKLLDRLVSGAIFLTGGVIECNIAHRRPVTVLCICIKSGVTRCTLFMVLYLRPMYVVRVTLGALVAHLYTYRPPSCRTSQHLMTSIPFSFSPWNDLGDILSDDFGPGGFKSRANVLFIDFYSFSFLFFRGAGDLRLRGCQARSSLAMPHF